MPDLIARSMVIFSNQMFLSAQFFHTPIACFFQSMAISCLFKKDQRAMVFYALTTGWLIHQAFDLLQLSPIEYYYLFWPSSDQTISIGLFYVDLWPWVAAITVFIAWLTSKKVMSFFSAKRDNLLPKDSEEGGQGKG